MGWVRTLCAAAACLACVTCGRAGDNLVVGEKKLSPLCGEFFCDLECPGGFARDTNGCAVCTCIGAESCPGANPEGCVTGGCDEGICATETDACIPTACSCDGENDAWTCTPDCRGGQCVVVGDNCAPVVCTIACEDGLAVDETGCEICRCACEPWQCDLECDSYLVDMDGCPRCECSACLGANPQGCSSTGCSDGFMCSFDTADCVPSACSCDETNGTWLCSADCSGGVCVPQ